MSYTTPVVPRNIMIDYHKHDLSLLFLAAYSDKETIQNLPTLDQSRQSSISSGQSENSDDFLILRKPPAHLLSSQKPPAPVQNLPTLDQF